VAADALMTLGYVGVKGGLVIVSADDPSLFSSQNEQDNRYYAKMAALPMLEPMDPQEAKDMTLAAFALSEEVALPVLLRTTTRVNHTRGAVTLGTLAPGRGRALRQGPLFPGDGAGGGPAGPRPAGWPNRTKVQALAETSPFNRLTGQGPWGVVTSGVAAAYAEDAIQELGLTDRVTSSSWASPTPCRKSSCIDFLRRVERVLVVEELEPYLEEG
jgi:indolepyruvate ferredoxin oxidoreductase, alpha subunit